MIFEHKDIDNPSKEIYGRRKGSRSFDMVMNLEIGEKSATVHGFIDRGCSSPFPCEYKQPLTPDEFVALWKYIRKISGRRYIEFDVLKDHAKVYKQFLYVVGCFVTMTHDGHEAEHLTVDMDQGIKHFDIKGE